MVGAEKEKKFVLLAAIRRKLSGRTEDNAAEKKTRTRWSAPQLVYKKETRLEEAH